MQLTTSPEVDSTDGHTAPLEGEVVLCYRLHDPATTDSTDTTTTTTRRQPQYYYLAAMAHLANPPTSAAETSDCEEPQGNTKKRKYEEEDKLMGEKEVDRVKDTREVVERYRRLLLRKKIILSSLTKGQNIPLFCIFGDLLLIPKFTWSNGDGGTRQRRRRSQVEPDLSTSIDSTSQSGEASVQLSRPRTPSLLHVEVCPDSDSQGLEEIGYNQEWFNNVTQSVVSHLNQFGVCVIDNFLGEERAEQILTEVGSLHTRGVFHDGQVVSRQEEARGRVRGDKITWVTGKEPDCGNIGQLVSVVDSLIGRCNNHIEAGKLSTYTIKWRTRPMVACYPGQGTHYVKHVDNPNGDGRCITAIYYINKDWRREDGGMLRIFPEGMNQVAEIEPLFDRMLFFWSDRRNPHEVMPSSVTRHAITVWYLDQREREEYLSRMSATATST